MNVVTNIAIEEALINTACNLALAGVYTFEIKILKKHYEQLCAELGQMAKFKEDAIVLHGPAGLIYVFKI